MPKDRTSNGFDGDQLSKYLIEIDKADRGTRRRLQSRAHDRPASGLAGGCGTRWRAAKEAGIEHVRLPGRGGRSTARERKHREEVSRSSRADDAAGLRGHAVRRWAPSGTRRSAARRSTGPQGVAGAVVSSSTNCAPNPEERSRGVLPCCHQPIAHERAGVRLSPLKAAIFDAIKAAGQSGVASYGLLHLFERPVKRSTVKVHVGQMQTLLLEDNRLSSSARIGGCGGSSAGNAEGGRVKGERKTK